MQYFKHRLNHVENYVHHRPPYLLVQEIISITSLDVIASMTVAADPFYIQGHFPGSPIMPGAMLQELTTQTAGVLIAAEYNPMENYNTEDPFHNEYALGVLVKVKHARYKGFARPGDELTANVVLQERISDVFDFTATVSSEDRLIMRNSFQLMNIKSQTLQGIGETC